MTTALNDATFAQVQNAPRAMVDFWSPECPYCVAFKPIFEDVASQLGGQYLMATLNVDQSPKSAEQFNIEALPTVIFFVNGKEVHRAEGQMDKADFLNEISAASSGGGTPGTPAPSTLGSVVGAVALLGVLAGIGYAVLKK